MTFEEFKAEFDATIGVMSPDELVSAFKKAGVRTSDVWVIDEIALDWIEPECRSCEDVAANSSKLALAA